MNLTVNSDGTFNFHNHIVIAQLVVACPSEKFEWKAGAGCDPSVKGKSGCGTMDISVATADPDDCLVAGGKMEGGATHDFIYNGDEARSIDSKDSKFGTVTLELTSLKHCDPHGNMPPPGPPVGPTPPSPAGKKYQCENVCEPHLLHVHRGADGLVARGLSEDLQVRDLRQDAHSR